MDHGTYRGDVRMVNRITGVAQDMPWGYATSPFAEPAGWYIECPNYNGQLRNNWGKSTPPAKKASQAEIDLQLENADLKAKLEALLATQGTKPAAPADTFAAAAKTDQPTPTPAPAKNKGGRPKK